MGRLKGILGSPILANVVGAFTLVATIVGIYISTHPSSTALPASLSAPDTAVVARPNMFTAMPPYLFIVTGVIGVGLLLPSWIALFRAAHSRPTEIRALALPRTTSRIIVDPVSAPDEQSHDSIDVSPFQLWGIYDQHLTHEARKLIDAYVRKRIQVAGTVIDVWEKRDGQTRVAITVLNPDQDSQRPNGAVRCQFDASWKGRTLTLRRNAHIKLTGQVAEVDSLFIDLDHCELVESHV